MWFILRVSVADGALRSICKQKGAAALPAWLNDKTSLFVGVFWCVCLFVFFGFFLFVFFLGGGGGGGIIKTAS